MKEHNFREYSMTIYFLFALNFFVEGQCFELNGNGWSALDAFSFFGSEFQTLVRLRPSGNSNLPFKEDYQR